MRILGLIPARGGSKRLPGKNIKELCGAPLIAWSIKSALASNCCVDVLVSTDDPEIAKISESYGALVPWLRPENLAADTTSSVDVAIHAVDMYEKERGRVDGLLLLQPTSPFRKVMSIQEACRIYKEKNYNHSIVSVSPAKNIPEWMFREKNGQLEPLLGWKSFNVRSQDIEDTWVLNGSIYLVKPENIRKNKKIISEGFVPLYMTRQEDCIDIDTLEDFNMCEEMGMKYKLSLEN